jgi:uncharacterized membrane protein
MINLTILIISIAGLFVANKIRLEKRSGKPMVCPLDGKCETVLHSKYATFVNVPLEYAGLLYYVFIFASYLSFLINPALQNSIWGLVVGISTVFGLFFSAYLTFVQWKIIKSWCTWCLFSAFTSTMLFFASFFSFIQNFDVVQIINKNIQIIFIADMFIVAFATSAVIVTEILHLKFLKDFRINEQESKVLMIMWQLIWVLIFSIATLTVIFFLAKDNTEVAYSTMRPIKLLIVVILSGISSFYLLPKMTKQSEKTTCLNVKFIVPARIALISVCAILIPTWIMLPASNITLYTTFLGFSLFLFNFFTIFIDNFSKANA